MDKRKIAEEKRHTCRVIKGGDRGNEFDFRSQLKRLQKEKEEQTVKTLKDADKVLRIMRAKLDELHRRKA